ncbi:MAG: peptidylprolyl isomerase [Vicinamibacterales bacterium]
MSRPVLNVLLLLLVVGCQRAPAQTTEAATGGSAQPAAASTQPQSPAGEAAAPAAAQPVPEVLPDVLARVNGEPIQKAEFERALRAVEAQAGGPIPADRRNEIYRDVLDQLVSYRLLIQETKNRKIVVSDADLAAPLAQVKQQFPTEDEFTKALAAQNMTEASLTEQIRQDMALSKLVEAEVRPLVKVSEAEIKDFYDKNPDRFQEAEAIRASHILVKVDPGATAAQKQEAHQKAEGVLKQVKDGGDFAALAKQFSDDGSGSQGGDLNFFGRGQMVPPFENAAFALKTGETSEIVESQFGFHIIKLTDRRAARTVPLADVAARIGQFLTSQQQQQKTNDFIGALRARSKVEILL